LSNGASPSRLASAAIAAGLIAAFCGAATADRNALWTIVHDQCVPNQEAHHDPAPCEAVTLDGGVEQGYAILKDRNGATQFLLIPTRRISGIESPETLAPDIPNYWELAWQARSFVEARAKHKLAWDMIGLAINPALRRSQDQLHIHIDCLRPDVRAALAEHIGEIGTQWTDLTFDLRGRRYTARRLDDAELAREDPFKLLARPRGGSNQDLAAETLVLVGARFGKDKNGFVLLADRGVPEKGIFAHGEDLLDHACALATAEEAASGKGGEP
jgi:CDP-diacylglycerol pyrophosphatase